VRAIVYTENGDPDVLQLVERPTPEPGPGEVRVRLAFSGVNPTDWKSRRTAPPGPDGQVPDQDGSGTVDAVGEGVDPVLVGERVWIWEAAWQRPHGTAAEYTVVPARQVVLLGAGPAFELGAALGIPFLTAHRCLTVAESLPDRLGPGALTGSTVLVQGGAGAVGNAAIQLAHWADATVIPNARWQFVYVYTVPERAKAIAVEDVNAAVLDGAVRVGEDAGLPLHVFPLAETAQAHRAVEDGTVGKVLVDVTA
jgi:NADPH2:quinone reductase